MVQRSLFVVACVLAAAAPAHANGRAPATSTINFRQGNDQHIAVGTTFGLLVSKDGGQTWRWFCEDALDYGGDYDPDFAYLASGHLFSTTFDEPRVNRDGCTFEPTALGTTSVSTSALASNGDLFMASVQALSGPRPTDSAIYKSSDGGATFPVSAMPAARGLWWTSIAVAPSDPMRVYASGYRTAPGTRTFELYRSVDGGVTYTPMALTGLTYSINSTIEIVGISTLDPDYVYLRITFLSVATVGEGLFASLDGGSSWTKIREQVGPFAFVARANGDLVATSTTAAFVSRHPSNGAAWEQLPDPPHISCLVENSAGEVWACTQNYAVMDQPSERAGIMKSTDLVTWTPVLRYEEIDGPADCAAGTVQHDSCTFTSPPPTSWCILRAQLGVSADPTTCPLEVGEAPVTKPGCCSGSTGGSMNAGMVMLAGLVLLRRRRR